MAKRRAVGTPEHDRGLVSIEQSKMLQYEASERERRDDNKIRGPQGYGSQLRGWVK